MPSTLSRTISCPGVRYFEPADEGYRVAIFDEETFLSFLKAWISWLETFPLERKLLFTEAAK